MEFRQLLLNDGKSILYVHRGEHGAISLSLERMPDELPELLWEDTVVLDAGRWMAMDLGKHFREPTEGYIHQQECPALETECWYGGTSLGAMAILKKWKEAGLNEHYIKWVLENTYRGVFDADE